MIFYRNGSHAHAAVRPITAPAPTVMFGARSNKVDWVDGASVWRVTPEEAATFQSYPCAFQLRGTRTSQFLQVGNAVPPIVAKSVLHHLWKGDHHMTDYSHHTVLDLFSGHGVGVAIRQLGAKEYAVDNSKDVNQTRIANGMPPVHYEDVWDVHRAEGLDFDTLWGSPVCPTFSAAGKGSGRKQMPLILDAVADKTWLDIDALREWSDSLEDVRSGLTLVPLHYIHRFRPTFVALEQVKEVVPIWEAYAVELESLGYSVWTGKITSEMYGVPQTRLRAYLIARNDGKEAKPPTPTHSRYHMRSPEKLDEGVLPWVSMAQALSATPPSEYPMTRPAPTVTGGGVSTGGWEPFGPGGRKAILSSLSATTAPAETPRIAAVA